MAAPIRSELEYSAFLETLYADVREGLAPEQQSAMTGLLDLLASPFAWEVLHTQWQLPPERITRACLAASQLIADGIRRHPEWLDPCEPLPPLFRAPAATSKRKEKQ